MTRPPPAPCRLPRRCGGRHAASRQRVAAAWLGVGLLASVPGCEVFAIIANAVFPPRVAARYRLADKPTLVLVDDPANHLKNPAMVGQIADRVGAVLTEADVLSTDHVIQPHLLYGLAQQLGDRFSQTPVDRIGRALGAQQVIHLHIKSMRLYGTPGLLRPEAAVAVKVINATEGTRLYPVSDPAEPQDNGIVTVLMRHRALGGDGTEPVSGVLNQLAERIGRDVARLFFDHLPRQPGEPFER